MATVQPILELVPTNLWLGQSQLRLPTMPSQLGLAQQQLGLAQQQLGLAHEQLGPWPKLGHNTCKYRPHY